MFGSKTLCLGKEKRRTRTSGKSLSLLRTDQYTQPGSEVTSVNSQDHSEEFISEVSNAPEKAFINFSSFYSKSFPVCHCCVHMCRAPGIPFAVIGFDRG
uniref:Uncharacterized protein n=1 Tax=Callorhinchus milii TaxID=7868 RepID=A0A4W3HB51_CALMI